MIPTRGIKPLLMDHKYFYDFSELLIKMIDFRQQRG